MQILFLTICSFPAINSTKAQAIIPYRNSKLAIHQRVEDLLSRMTLQEKIAQTWCSEGNNLPCGLGKSFLQKKADSLLKNGLGEMTAPGGTGNSREAVLLANEIQHYFVTQTRLGIPVIFHQESLHGSIANDATVFPTILGMSCAFDRELMKEVIPRLLKKCGSEVPGRCLHRL